MRVLLIGDYPPPAGGIATHVAQLHRYLREQGVETRVLDIGKGGRPAPDVVPARAPLQFGGRLAQFLAAGWLAHLHTSGNNRTSWLVALATAAAGLPFAPWPVVTVHSGLVPAFLSKTRGHRLLARAALFGFARVIAVSAPVARALEQTGGCRKPPLVQPAFLASQLGESPPPARFVKARARWPVLVAMAYAPSPVYGLEAMLGALSLVRRRVPGIGLALFGPGSDSPAVGASAANAGVADRVAGLGELPHGEALGVIGASEVFARPTLADGDSISVREALALGVPVVASDAAARPPGVVVYGASGGGAALADGLVQALAAGRLAAAVADAGPALLALYASLLTKERGPSTHATPG